ncbi:hypothetical protein PCE1_003604 [Barthelona sp. PCE]
MHFFSRFTDFFFSTRPLSCPLHETEQRPEFEFTSFLQKKIVGNSGPLIPCIFGHVDMQTFDGVDSYGKDTTFQIGIIARRHCARLGKRFIVRGIDDTGSVANCVETEFFICDANEDALSGETTFQSMLMLRGSIPLYWEQKANMRISPPIRILKEDHYSAFEKHFEQLAHAYEKVVCVDLVNQSGKESVLQQKFEELCTKAEISYHAFDFHKECANMQYHNLNKLMEKLEPEFSSSTVTISPGVSTVDEEQTSVFRVNCMDCLDRTNVCQSSIARFLFDRCYDGQFTENEAAQRAFRYLWADHGDVLALQYAASPAMKRDFVRTGRRSPIGVLCDGSYSIRRFISGNFIDHNDQNAIDIMQGRDIEYKSNDKMIKILLASFAFIYVLLRFMGVSRKQFVLLLVILTASVLRFMGEKFVCHPIWKGHKSEPSKTQEDTTPDDEQQVQ